MDVDAALVRLARESGASLITVDHNLAKVAEALRVPVAQMNALASTFRIAVRRRRRARRPRGEGRAGARAGGRLPGRRHDGRRRAGDDADRLAVEVRVRNVIQTTTGRMIFASPLGLDSPATAGADA